MRLFLVRHGETVDNVAGLYAGVTDSALTNHGVLQANRLGAHLAATDVRISHIFSSDLSRAFKTAEAIRLAQPNLSEIAGQSVLAKTTVQSKHLREKDFGSLERKSWSERTSRSRESNKNAVSIFLDSKFKDVESKESMRGRADAFIDEHLLPLLITAEENHTTVIVAHGIILAHLWQSILKHFLSTNVSIDPAIGPSRRGFSLEHLGDIANTGYFELTIQPNGFPSTVAEALASATAATATNEARGLQTSPDLAVTPEIASTKQPEITAVEPPSDHKLLDMTVVVKALNCTNHLKNLKKTRGGIGSSAHDEGQKTIETFFKRQKIG